MTALRLILAVGAGAAFSAGLLTFATTFARYRAQGCPPLTDPTPDCAAAVSMMQATALVVLTMIAVLWVLLKRGRAADA